MHRKPFWGAVFLVVGTSIGAGMLALPVVTATYGFFPAVGLFFVCWFFMLLAALLMLEVTLWFPAGSNIISMAKATLGVPGKVLAWVSYLFLLYTLMAAYLSGIAELLVAAVGQFLHQQLSVWVGLLLLVFLFSVIIFLGTRVIDYGNRLLMLGMLLVGCVVLALLVPHAQPIALLGGHLYSVWLALPVVVTSFGFQIVIPSIATYLLHDAVALRKVIIMGSIIPLLTYILWEGVVLGVLPGEGEHGLHSIMGAHNTVLGLGQAFSGVLDSAVIAALMRAFEFFVMVTSFIGVSLSLFDFLMDGFDVVPKRVARFCVIVGVFLPPALLVLTYPKLFMCALGYGGIFVALLLILLPAAMAWSGRYYKAMASGHGYCVCGGRGMLVVMWLFAAVILALQLGWSV